MCCIFFFNDTATTEIYTLSLHDALPISASGPPPLRPPRTLSRHPLQRAHRRLQVDVPGRAPRRGELQPEVPGEDRKSTRLNSSHANISYAVFCLKKKNKSM